MTKAQTVFEATMRVKRHADLTMTATGKYTVPQLQTRWVYFQLGWEMCEVVK
jgi:hypothetical protein